MRLQPIISGLIIGAIGFVAYYYNFLGNLNILGVPLTYGIMGLGAFLVLLGLGMKRRI